MSGIKLIGWERFCEDFFAGFFKIYPEEAIHFGIEGYNHLTHDVSDDAYCEEKEFWRKSRVSLGNVSENRLTMDEKIDYLLLRGKIVIKNHEFDKDDYRFKDPGSCLPFGHIYSLLSKPNKDVAGSVVNQLINFPKTVHEVLYNMAGKQLSVRPPTLWITTAMDSIKGGIEFLNSLPENTKLKEAIKDKDAFTNHINRAKSSAEIFGEFLKRDVYPESMASYAVGEKHYDLLLKQKHFLDMSAGKLLYFGEKLFRNTKNELAELADKLYPGKSIPEATNIIHSRHPQQNKLLDSYKKAMADARSFTIKNRLVTFPSTEKLNVVWTPEFQRHEIPFAAYESPALSDFRLEGYYYVSPAKDEETLGEHNWAGIDNTSVHEAYPGHHLQFSLARSNPQACTFPRILCESSVMYEGWGIYCEQLMVEEGFLKSPEHRFIMLIDRLWRALRIIIDVRTQVGDMIFDEAVELMEKELSFPRSQACADLNWYSQAPTVPMGYALGWKMINDLRDSEKSRLGSRFNLREFHDKFLSCGSIPVPLIIKRHFSK